MADEDYDVLRNGKVVGRIYDDASAGTPPDMRWFPSVTAIVPATPGGILRRIRPAQGRGHRAKCVFATSRRESRSGLATW
jgi:hypothetical protein